MEIEAVKFAHLSEGHPIKKFCKEHDITDPVVGQALCDLVRGAVVAAIVGLVSWGEAGGLEG